MRHTSSRPHQRLLTLGETGALATIALASVGAAALERIASSVQAHAFGEVVDLADQALLAAKRAGRDRVVVAGDVPTRALEPAAGHDR
jgi:GGDEF domain-containing protein